MDTSPAIRCYFSFRSPFAAIAFYRLRRAPQFRDVIIELMPVWPAVIFGGHMDNPTDNYFKMVYIFTDAARQAELAGMETAWFRALAKCFDLPDGVDYRAEKLGLKLPEEPWEIPHMAFWYAQSQGRGWAFGEAVFNRRFNLDGQGAADVLDPQVLAGLAEEVGLDGARAAGAHAGGEFDDQQRDCIAASERDGVFGVPFFVLDGPTGRATFWGNDRLEHVLRALTGGSELPEIPASSLTRIQPGRT